MRILSEGEPRLRTKRKGFFACLLEALDRSRRREAMRVLRRYRHLIDGHVKPAPEFRALARGPATVSRRLTALIGFGGGLVGGLTAMPGAIPTIWCDMRGLPKSDQRGLVQPFIAIMQVLALALLLGRQSLSSKLVIDLAISLPALFAGSLLGIVAFRNINEIGFRRTILVLLLVSGASLALA